MSKLKHTPGPWKVHQNFKQMVHNDKVQIANMGANSCFPVKRLSDKENEANAQLISVAPDMLQLLKYIRDWFEGEGESFQYSEEVDQLITQAERSRR